MVKNLLLIDGRQSEEIRVVQLNNDGEIEALQYESVGRKQLKGNIYLGQIIAVEPSLQAAFIDYGGSKHGFLPFFEIHPRYYCKAVPDIEDTQELRQITTEQHVVDREFDKNKEKAFLNNKNIEECISDDLSDIERINEDIVAKRSSNKFLCKNYRIQDFVKAKQNILVQVTKEERGNKGASLTTYITLVGRYCIFMPYSDINNKNFAFNVKEKAAKLDIKDKMINVNVPSGGGLMLKSLAIYATRDEIKHDFAYLRDLWDKICARISNASSIDFVYCEQTLIKRLFRDMYSDKIDSIVVDGNEVFKLARSLAKQIIPTKYKKIKRYQRKVPIFVHYDVEKQIESLYNSVVNLRSGGHIVISRTEALIAIDVNSGRSAGKKDIEETALKTNIDAAVVIAKHLRIRELSGLIVIDFIDMSEYKNKRNVYNVLKENLLYDKAKIQLGNINAFGILILSRQRVSPSFLEVNMEKCFVCNGGGFVKNVREIVNTIVRSLIAYINDSTNIDKNVFEVLCDGKAAIFFLNQYRDRIKAIENKYKISVIVKIGQNLCNGSFVINSMHCKASKSLVQNNYQAAEKVDVIFGPVSNKDTKKKK